MPALYMPQGQARKATVVQSCVTLRETNHMQDCKRMCRYAGNSPHIADSSPLGNRNDPSTHLSTAARTSNTRYYIVALLFILPYRHSIVLTAVSCSLVKPGRWVGHTQLMQVFACQLQKHKALNVLLVAGHAFEHKFCCYDAQRRRLLSYFILLY